MREAAMTMNRILVSIAGTVLSATACAVDPRSPSTPEQLRGSDCIFFRTLYDWQELDEQNLVIWAPGTRRDAYHVYLTMPLVGLKFEWQLAFVDKDRDGMLCGFSSDQVVVQDRSFPQQASIAAMKKLDAEGIAKLEERFKIKLTRTGKKQKPPTPSAAAAQ